jgi:hypothetical protein
LCGWSILVENAKKRQEVAFFVAPRAAAVLLPRRYDIKVHFPPSPKGLLPSLYTECLHGQHQWRENTAFALSTAIVLTGLQEKPDTVRGVLGRLLNRVFR